MSGGAGNYGTGNEWDYVPDTEPGQAERDYDQQEIAAVRAEMEAEQQAEYEAEQRGEFDQQTEADAVAAHDAEYEELIERYESGQPARSDKEQAEYDHLAACADEPEDPQAADDWTPDTSQGLPVEIGSAISDVLPWLEARERKARVASDAEAWGGRGPSASYAEWAAEGTAGTPARPQPDGPEAGT